MLCDLFLCSLHNKHNQFSKDGTKRSGVLDQLSETGVEDSWEMPKMKRK